MTTPTIARPRARLRTTIVVLLFVVGAIPLVLLGSRLSSFNRERLEVQQQEYQLVLAEAIARELGEFVRAERGQLQGFADGLAAAIGVSGAERALEAVSERELLTRLLAQDPDLEKLILARWSAVDQADHRQYNYVQAERSDSHDHAAAVEMLVKSLLELGFRGRGALATPPGEPPVLVIVSPVQGSDGVSAVIAALVGLDGLRGRLGARSQELYLIYLTDREGSRLLARSRTDGGREALLGSDLVAAFREGGGTRTMPFRVAAEAGDRDMLGAFATVPETGWGVFVEVDAEVAYHDVLLMRQTTAYWTVASILVALIAGALFARRIVGPIHELAEGALRLARGDFSRRLEIRSGDEIGVLADSFNHMADEISEQIDKLAAAAKENKELFLASIRMLAEAIDEKDPYTRGHSERVARYSVAVAESMQLSVEDIERVQIGALLHDVGKIGIDDRILRKPTVLTDAEFEIMKQHPEKGAHIMSAVRELREIIPGMRYHHEKVDGTGYPLGLKGDDIPLEAQIISVSDTFDAMTTDRPYQRGMEPEFVIEKLKGWIGSRFRSDVVYAFERAYRAGEVAVRRPLARPSARNLASS